MLKALVPIADGSEEMEAVIIIDVLRRAGIDVCVASVMADRKVAASRGVELVADCHIEYCQNKPWDMVVIPGGMPGAEHMAKSRALLDIISDQISAQRWLAAICAAPAVVLAANGFITGASATCYPAFRHILDQHNVHAMIEPVSIHNKLITGQGPGTAMQFALTLVSLLVGEVQADKVANEMCFQRE